VFGCVCLGFSGCLQCFRVSCVFWVWVESIFAPGLWLVVIYSRWFTGFGDMIGGFNVSGLGCGFLGDSPHIR
jgi:hypothetical protein